jgi:uncharacterized membrane protein (DUF2068 family)
LNEEVKLQNLTGRSRPLGITIIAIIMGIQGILGIIAGILSLTASGAYPAFAVTGIITLILGVLYLVLAWGLWTLQPWAFWGTVVLEVIALINGIFALSQHNTGTGLLNIVIALIILIYLFADRNVRAAFRT